MLVPITGNGTITTVRETKSTSNQGNIYCMYGVYQDSFIEMNGFLFHNPTIDWDKFGDTGLIILNPREFIKRCQEAAENQDITIKENIVSYYDDKNYDGPLSPWHKREKYRPQSEFRLYYPNMNHQPYSLGIDSIEDIACIFTKDDVFLAKDNGDGSIGRFLVNKKNNINNNGKTK